MKRMWCRKSPNQDLNFGLEEVESGRYWQEEFRQSQKSMCRGPEVRENLVTQELKVEKFRTMKNKGESDSRWGQK